MVDANGFANEVVAHAVSPRSPLPVLSVMSTEASVAPSAAPLISNPVLPRLAIGLLALIHGARKGPGERSTTFVQLTGQTGGHHTQHVSVRCWDIDVST